MRVVILRGKVSRTILLGGVLISKGCSEDYMYLFLFSTSDTFILVHGSCDHDWHTLYLFFSICGCMLLSRTSTCVVSFLPLYTCFLYLYAIYYLCFTQRCFDEFCLKCFRNTGCQSLLVINSLLAKIFKSLC